MDGSYDDAFDLTIQAAEEFGWYCRNTGYNPFTAEGKKTAALEIWEWWSSEEKAANIHDPLTVFVSVGDGNIISGIHKGFKDLQALGWMEQMPRIIGVQAKGLRPLRMPSMPGRSRLLLFRPKPLPIASRWTCPGTACAPCGRPAKPAVRIFWLAMMKFCRPLLHWARRVSLLNRPGRPLMPAW